MKTTKKALLLTLCAVLLVAATVVGTMAYLTDSENAVNTFTVGKVYIDLDETDVDNTRTTGESGKPIEEGRDRGNAYHLLPGHTYVKDPTVTVLEDSEKAYVRMLVTVTYNANADAVFAKYGVNNWLNIDETNWNSNGNPVTTKDTDKGTITRTYEFRYKEIVAKNETADTKLPALFTQITVPDDVTNAEIAHLAGMQIDIVAHAIQADGFDNADDAWANFS